MTDPTHVAVSADGRSALTEHIVADEYGADISEAASDAEIAAMAAASSPSADWTAWRVGDAARELHRRHGEDWLDYMPDTGLAPKTQRNYRTVAAAWRNRSRRREWDERGLSHGHLAAVASIAAEDVVSAEEWLELAEAGDWSVTALRKAVKGETPPVDVVDAAEVALAEYVEQSIHDWLEAEGLTLLSDGQVASLASTVLEAMRRWEKAQPLPFEPDHEEEGERQPYEVAYDMSQEEPAQA